MTTEGCPFYTKKVTLSCYVFSPGRYKSLEAFLNNNASGIARFTIAGNGNLECMDILGDPIQAKPNAKKCINCMFCVFGCPGHKYTISKTYQLSSHCNDSVGTSNWGPLPEKLKDAFSGKLFIEEDFQNTTFFNPLGRYQGFDDFTSVDETKNIAVWLGNAIKFLLGSKSRVSLEIPVEIPGADRDGRIDVCGIMSDFLIACETKTNFKELMSDKRFVEQMSGYEKKLSDELTPRGIRYQQYLVIGGSETDLLPPGDPRGTTTLGNDLEFFYRLLKKHKIQFISAKAFLLLGMRALLDQHNFNLESELMDYFAGDKAGLLTCGPVGNI
jgi:ferredoxin